MKGLKYIIITFFIIIFSNSFIQAEETTLNLIVDIAPHISLEIPEDIVIKVDQPWIGEVKEFKSKLFIQTNTEVELSWQSTPIKNLKTGRVLPFGISDELLKNLNSGEKISDAENSFALNVFLSDSNYQIDYDNLNYLIKDRKKILKSLESADKKTLSSQRKFLLYPGKYDFDIVLQYYWAKGANWSNVSAGRYQGEIIYTVAAVNED